MKISLLLYSLLLAGASLAEAPIKLEISGANFRPLPLAVAPPIVQDAALRSPAAEMDEALRFDLAASGIFQLLDRKSFLASSSEGTTAASINFTRWADVGAEALIKTQVSNGEQAQGELRIFTVATGREELKVVFATTAKDIRRMAHYFADQVFRFYTREPGVFQTHITYVRRSEQGKNIWRADWDGKNATQITTGELNLLPCLSPDGLAVAFTSYRKGKPHIYYQKLNSSTATPLIQGTMATGVAFSPNGKRIAYSYADQDGDTQVWSANPDGSHTRRLTNTQFFINTSPTWSPDDKRIAFVSNRGGSPQIYVMSANGGDVRRLTFQGNYNQEPSWSPRGDLIVFTARDERNAFDLFSINVDSAKITRLTQDQGNNQEAVFSPNGRMILFTSNRLGGTTRLFVMTPDGNNQFPLPAEKGEYSTPDWGP